jgi:hypothetical protein
VVVPPEFLPDPETGRGAARPTDGEALLVDRFDEVLALTNGFQRVGPEPSMKDPTALKIKSRV